MVCVNSTILIINGAAENCDALAVTLGKAGYDVQKCTSAKEGVAQIKACLPKLIILDVALPDKNGFVLCSELKADPLTHHIPILLTSSSFVESSDKAYGLDSGADGYLVMPTDPIELVATVRALLRITEAEKNLKETDDKLRLMVESVTDYAIFSLDLEGRISIWNAGAERLFGYTEEEIIGQSGSILYTKEDQERGFFRDKLRRAFENGKVRLEMWHVHKNGQPIYVTGVTTAVHNSAGEIIGYTKVARDITRTKEIEAKLRQSQNIFKTMADTIPALVWMTDVHKNYYYFNKVLLDFTGRSIEEEAGYDLTMAVHPDDHEAGIAKFNEAFDNRESFEVTYRLMRHDGVYRWVLDRGEPHYDLDGNFIGYTGACFDIHDKILAENKLQESETRFDLAMQGMNDGLFDYDLKNNTIYFSPRYKELLGYSDHEIENSVEAIRQFIHPDDLEDTFKTLENDLASGNKEYKNIFRMLHKDGSHRWTMSRGLILYNDEGAPVRMVGAHTDITEQKEFEVMLQEAYLKAEAANLAKTEFLANMSHEIRTPMNAIIGLANILTTTELSEKQKKFITTLQLSAESLLILLNDLLDISKIEDNMITLEEVAFDMHEMITNVITMMSVKANEKSLKLELIYPEDIVGGVIGDPLRLQQVLVNLIGNAIKFTANGGITINVQIQEGHKPNNHKISIQVKDTGIGIPHDKLQTIFEKFTQADNSTTRKYGGTGLGLTICKALIEKMGGTISVSSDFGNGSCFEITLELPKSHKEQTISFEPTKVDMSESIQIPSNCVLLVEDYPPNILVATTILEKLGYNYETATSGLEALEKFKNRSFHAILMDVQMHGMDGFETTRHIRLMEQEKNLQPSYIIAMTAHALVGDKEKCLEAGMDDYLSKPFNPDELKEKLSSLDQ
jgi:PAS domain S-box-containing protein